MSLTAANQKKCLPAPLAAYIDGELSLSEELELEMHLAICKSCAAKLNEQKLLSCALDFALEDEKQIELPANFTKVVVANAQSSVSGLRSPRERLKAFSVCLGLLLLVLFALNREAATVFITFVKFTEQLLAIFNFILHLVYDLSIGIAVILRSLGNHLVGNSSVATVFLLAFFFVSLFAFTRLFARFGRA